MDLAWYTEDDLKNTTLFNDNSIITFKNNNTVIENKESIIENKINIKVENCFEQKMDINTSEELLNILQYLSLVSNTLRTSIRNKNIKQYKDDENQEKTVTTIIQIINQVEYDKIIGYLTWIRDASIKIKKYFAVPYRKDNSFDPSNIKPFKTSSYKFCNFKESCAIHKNKNRTCDKNHFVFDMIINDISKLIESMELLNIDNLNWILNNKNILVNYSVENKDYSITKLNNNQGNLLENEYMFLIDKTLIFKSFDVSSYVLNKMYEEAFSFLNFNIQTCQIIL